MRHALLWLSLITAAAAESGATVYRNLWIGSDGRTNQDDLVLAASAVLSPPSPLLAQGSLVWARPRTVVEIRAAQFLAGSQVVREGRRYLDPFHVYLRDREESLTLQASNAGLTLTLRPDGEGPRVLLQASAAAMIEAPPALYLAAGQRLRLLAGDRGAGLAALRWRQGGSWIDYEGPLTPVDGPLTVLAADALGNSTQMEWGIALDAEGPEIAFTAESPALLAGETSPRLSWSEGEAALGIRAVDKTPGPCQIYYSLDHQPWQLSSGRLTCGASGTLLLYARDPLGNASAVRALRLDKAAGARSR